MRGARGIEHDGLTKTRLIEAMRDADVREDYDEDEMEEARVEGLDNGDELGLGDGSPGSSGSVMCYRWTI